MSDGGNQVRVFISYSWTSEEHQNWVADLGERLMSDGVDVVLDQWSLRDGQDLNAFMERMVKDPSIQRVLIVSDAAYAEKADTRRGGVGTESQIVSKDVYDDVGQEKFVPIVREWKDGEPCLPIYLRTRKYIDLSDPIMEEEAYEKLLRNIFDRPIRRKPPLGQPPSHIMEESSEAQACSYKATRFATVVKSGKGNPIAAFDDFQTAFLQDLEGLRMAYSNDRESTWCEDLAKNIQMSRRHRDSLVDVVMTGARYVTERWFLDSIISLLEQLIPYARRPEATGTCYECSEDNYKFMLYEWFLYIYAAFVTARRYADARGLIEHVYVFREHLQGSGKRSESFTVFNQYPRSLEEICGQRGDRRRLSVVADYVHHDAKRSDISFTDVVQADLLCCLSSVQQRTSCWFPKSLIYSRDQRLELFLRAVTQEGMNALHTLLKLERPQDLLELRNAERMQNVMRSEEFFHADVCIGELMNIEEISRAWFPGKAY